MSTPSTHDGSGSGVSTPIVSLQSSDLDGLDVGANVGSLVGENEGLFVGAGVGLLVGDGVGLSVGVGVGS